MQFKPISITGGWKAAPPRNGGFPAAGNALAQVARAVIFQSIMTRDRVQTAIDEGIPFLIRMADGEKYKVSDRYRVALGKTTVIVVGNDDMPHILPLLTMTGISYLKPARS